jgi:hypothetical protein
MELECPIKTELNELRSAVVAPVEVSGIAPTLRRTGNQISRFSMALYLLGSSLATESTPLCWILARLLCSAKGRLLDSPEASRQTTAIASHPAQATVKDKLTARAFVCSTPDSKNESFRNIWTPPETGESFKRGRLFWMSHGVNTP